MLPTKRFQRHIEDFDCENCGQFTRGNGYTNHCPECLWSKHVDIHPGDRAQSCYGLMEPMECEALSDGYRIIHRCTSCGQYARVHSTKGDSMEKIIELSISI